MLYFINLKANIFHFKAGPSVILKLSLLGERGDKTREEKSNKTRGKWYKSGAIKIVPKNYFLNIPSVDLK